MNFLYAGWDYSQVGVVWSPLCPSRGRGDRAKAGATEGGGGGAGGIHARRRSEDQSNCSGSPASCVSVDLVTASFSKLLNCPLVELSRATIVLALPLNPLQSRLSVQRDSMSEIRMTFRDDLQLAGCADPTRPRVGMLKATRGVSHPTVGCVKR